MVKIYNKLTNFRAMKYANLPRSASEKGGVPPEMGANRSRKRGELGRRWRLPEMGEIGQKWGKIGAGNGMRRRSGPVCAGRSMLGSRDRESWVGGSSRNPVDLGGVGDLVPVCDRARRRKRGQIGSPKKGEIGRLMGKEILREEKGRKFFGENIAGLVCELL